jgi:hypothetical protein
MPGLHVLILEDTPQVIESLRTAIEGISNDTGVDLRTSIYTTSREVEEEVNRFPAGYYDAIILDRNAADGGSFHVLDIERFGAEKIISISSLPHLNLKAAERGVNRLVDKNHRDLAGFTAAVVVELRDILGI